MKCSMKFVMIVAATVMLCFSSAHAATIVQSTLEIIPGVASNNGGNATEVDYWYFTANSAGTVTIDTLSWLHDFDGDGVSYSMDPYIYLFSNDGVLDAADYITENDDSGSTFGDGSNSSLDSYISASLGAGNYVLAISDYYLNLGDAINGINYNGYYPMSFDGTTYLHNYQGYNIPFADYQITFGGDVTVQQPVPEPATMLLLGTGLIGLAGARRKLKK